MPSNPSLTSSNSDSQSIQISSAAALKGISHHVQCLPSPNEDFEIRIQHQKKEIFSVEVVDGSGSWCLHQHLQPDQQRKIRQLIRTLDSLEPNQKVDRNRVRGYLKDALSGSEVTDLQSQTVRLLCVPGSFEGRVPVHQQRVVFERFLCEAEDAAVVGAIYHFRETAPELIRGMRREKRSALLERLIGSLKTPDSLGAFPLTAEIGIELAKSCFLRDNLTVTALEEGIKALAQSLNQFPEDSRRKVVQTFCEEAIRIVDTKSLFTFLQHTPPEARLPYDSLRGILERIPKHRQPTAEHLVMKHLSLFSEEEIPRIAEENILAGGITLIDLVPRGAWRKIDHEGLALKILDHPKLGMAALKTKLHHFESLSPEIARRLIDAGNFDDVVNCLGSFHHLSPNIASDLARKGSFQRVLQHMSSFQWEQESFDHFLGQQLESTPEVVLENLSNMPVRMLRSGNSRHFLLSYLEEVKLPSVEIYHQYSELKRAGRELEKQAFVERVLSLADRVVSSGRQADELLLDPLYKDFVRILYPANGGGFGFGHFAGLVHGNPPAQLENLDRSVHLEHFTCRPLYPIDLSEGVTMCLKPNQETFHDKIDALQAPIETARGILEKGFREEKERKAIVTEGLNKISSVPKSGEPAERIAKMAIQAALGRAPRAEFIQAFLLYHTGITVNELDFYQGTRERSEQARNRDYAYLLLLREFFADRLRDTAKAVAKDAAINGRIRQELPAAIAESQLRDEEERLRLAAARGQLSKRGITDGLLINIEQKLRDPNIPRDKKYEIVARIIESEQRKVAHVLDQISGVQVDPLSLHLGDYSESSFISREPAKEGERDQISESMYGPFLVQCFDRLVAPDIEFLDREIAKFQPEECEERGVRKLEAFFSKNHSSYFARRVGGVCVANDGPLRGNFGFGMLGQQNLAQDLNQVRPNQWDLPNYFQLVMRDPETLRCEGLVLLHHYQENGVKLLTASFNPSSTYLYKVNERELFRALLDTLIDFAKRNDFNAVGVSTSQHIRTNRTGGVFEVAMNRQIEAVETQFRLEESVPFSFSPHYLQQEFDLLWKGKDFPE
ncbi:MAG: hypothetical protein KDD64_00455 [Bdellovibrionales bacterium]|nr:hypothetical protein [Bdellovibrionales bacterium]